MRFLLTQFSLVHQSMYVFSMFEKEDVKHILLECKETRYWRHDKWLNMNKEITYRKILKTTNRTHIQNIGKYLDIVKNKWFSKIKYM